MPKIVDHAARRTEIVHGLWQVIYTCGINAVTFRSVAGAAGISIGRVQHYFPSREGLILEGCRQLVASADLGGSDDAKDRVAELTEFLHAFIPSGEAMRMGASVWFTYVAKAVGDPDIAEIVVANDRRTEEAAVERVERARAQSGESVLPAADVAARIVALAKGLAQEVMLGVRSPESAYRILDDEVDRIVSF